MPKRAPQGSPQVLQRGVAPTAAALLPAASVCVQDPQYHYFRFPVSYWSRAPNMNTSAGVPAAPGSRCARARQSAHDGRASCKTMRSATRGNQKYSVLVFRGPEILRAVVQVHRSGPGKRAERARALPRRSASRRCARRFPERVPLPSRGSAVGVLCMAATTAVWGGGWDVSISSSEGLWFMVFEGLDRC